MKNRLIQKIFLCLALVVGIVCPQNLFAGHASSGLKILEDIEAGFISLAEHTLPSVVSISPYVPPSPSIKRGGHSKRSRPTSAGAGVILDGEKGYIVTNSHVIRDADKVQVTLYGGEKLIGVVIGADEDTDIAVVKVEADKTLPSAELGDSGKLKIGQLVVAIGNPFGLSETLSFGVISGLNRENVNISRYEDFIQTDASINPGNSGGPLLNIRGEVIGINTAIINYAQNIGFAIPSNIVRNVFKQIVETGEVRRGWLGVGIEFVPDDVAQKANLKKGQGVMVNSVFDDQPASKAGVKVGDIILKIGGTPIKSPNSMIRLIGSITPGQSIKLDIIRGTEHKSVSITLAKRKEFSSFAALPDSPRPELGFRFDDSADDSDSDQGVRITEILSGSPAEHGGLKVGDIIKSINGAEVKDKRRVREILSKAPGGEPVYFLISRNDESINITLIFEE